MRHQVFGALKLNEEDECWGRARRFFDIRNLANSSAQRRPIVEPFTITLRRRLFKACESPVVS